jgi:hypothetical protein
VGSRMALLTALIAKEKIERVYDFVRLGEYSECDGFHTC